MQFQPRQEPGYSQAYAPASDGGFATAKILKPEFSSLIEVRKPEYNKQSPQPTIFRPFPCRSYTDPNNAFEPYRKDPGGQNFFGYWLLSVQVAWNVGNPSTTFIVQTSANAGMFDVRTTPMAILYRAIDSAVKRAQNKQNSWQVGGPKPFEPPPSMVLKWSGMKEGGTGRSATLTWPQPITLLQGYVIVSGGKPMYNRPEGMPGWPPNKPCVFMLTAGPSRVLNEQLSLENQGFNGDPGDFERRYVFGDVVAPEHGAFLVLTPKGGEVSMQNVPVSQNIFSGGRQAPQHAAGSSDRGAIGFDLKLEKRCSYLNGFPAHFTDASHVDSVRRQWRYWEDIVHYPSEREQAQLLSKIFPASMIAYAFDGEHSEWMTDDIRQAARAELEAEHRSVPAPSVAAYGSVPVHGNQGPSQSIYAVTPAQPAPGPGPASWQGYQSPAASLYSPMATPVGMPPPNAAMHSVTPQFSPPVTTQPFVPPTGAPGAQSYTAPQPSVPSTPPAPTNLVAFPPEEHQAALTGSWGASLDASVAAPAGEFSAAMAGFSGLPSSAPPVFASVSSQPPSASGVEQPQPTDSAELARQLQAMLGQ